MPLTQPFGTSCGSGLPVAAPVALYALPSTAKWRQIGPRRKRPGKLPGRVAHLSDWVGVSGNFKSP